MDGCWCEDGYLQNSATAAHLLWFHHKYSQTEEYDMKNKSYVLWNNKGGVGKSTITFHIASVYAEKKP